MGLRAYSLVWVLAFTLGVGGAGVAALELCRHHREAGESLAQPRVRDLGKHAGQIIRCELGRLELRGGRDQRASIVVGGGVDPLRARDIARRVEMQEPALHHRRLTVAIAAITTADLAPDKAGRRIEDHQRQAPPRHLLLGEWPALTAIGERDQLAACLRALGSLLRDVSILAGGGDRSLIGNSDLEPQLASLAKSFDGKRAATAYAAVDEALAALERNASPKIVADWLVLQL